MLVHTNAPKFDLKEYNYLEPRYQRQVFVQVVSQSIILYKVFSHYTRFGSPWRYRARANILESEPEYE